MSDPILIRRVSELLDGDIVRATYSEDYFNDGDLSLINATYKVRPGGAHEFAHLFTTGITVEVIERQVILPTVPYSVIAPPIGKESVNYPCVLQPVSVSRQLEWIGVEFGGQCTIMDAAHVRNLIKNEGWRIIAAAKTK